MSNQTDIPLEDRLVELMRHLGIERSHFAACMPRDWEGLAQHRRAQMASLTLICPMGINLQALGDKPRIGRCGLLDELQQRHRLRCAEDESVGSLLRTTMLEDARHAG